MKIIIIKIDLRRDNQTGKFQKIFKIDKNVCDENVDGKKLFYELSYCLRINQIESKLVLY